MVKEIDDLRNKLEIKKKNINIKDMTKQETIIVFDQLCKFIRNFVDRNYPPKNKEGELLKIEGKTFTVDQIRDILNDNVDEVQKKRRELVELILRNAMYDYLAKIGARNLRIMDEIDSGNFNNEEVSEEKDFVNGVNYILGVLHKTPHPLEELRKLPNARNK